VILFYLENSETDCFQRKNKINFVKKPENKGFFKRKIPTCVREGGRTVGAGKAAESNLE